MLASEAPPIRSVPKSPSRDKYPRTHKGTVNSHPHASPRSYQHWFPGIIRSRWRHPALNRAAPLPPVASER